MTALIATIMSLMIVLWACQYFGPGRAKTVGIILGGMVACFVVSLAIYIGHFYAAPDYMTANEAVSRGFVIGFLCAILTPVFVIIARRKLTAASGPALSRR